MDSKFDAEVLLAKYRNGTADARERRLVEQFLLLDMERNVYLPAEEKLDAATEAIGKAIAAYADKHPDSGMVIPLRPWYRRYARGLVAAAVVALLTVAWLFVDNRQQLVDNRLAASGIQPGGNRATLTLADGRTIDLNEAQSGIIVGDGITYSDGSEVVSEGALSTDYNILTTPKGGTYQITLPDGSNVWLNANSTLRYPSRFSEHERVVELEGEAYFDVRQKSTDSSSGPTAHSKQAHKVPFKVRTAGQVVEVLGTQFNISAYGDVRETHTTLVEGSVRLRAEGSGITVSLVPGEQGKLANGTLTKAQVSTDQFTAWRDGLFMFNETRLDEIMLSVSRWYDVEVVFEDEKLRSEPFVGVIDRFSEVTDVLALLEITGNVRFQVTGRKIVVLPVN